MPNRIRGTSIYVDLFRPPRSPSQRQQRPQPQPQPQPLFFLTHTHTDHLAGLKDGWCGGKIFCSETSKRLLLRRFAIDERRLVALPIGEPKLITGVDVVGAHGESFCVTLLDANHCAGAVMFFFQGPFGNILHTGDCRATPSVTRSVLALGQRVDVLYLDNTFCEPRFEFPTRDAAARDIIECISNLRQRALVASEAFSSSSDDDDDHDDDLDDDGGGVNSTAINDDEQEEEATAAAAAAAAAKHNDTVQQRQPRMRQPQRQRQRQRRRRRRRRQQQLRVVISVPGVGKEELLVKIARHFQTKIQVDRELSLIHI